MKTLLMQAVQAALQAGRAVMEIYETNFTVDFKADASPLTLADKRSHKTIQTALMATGIPVLSEEGKKTPFSQRRQWERLWIVDPLDGTKEFVKRNGEFTVNIALIQQRRPVLGVVYAPAPRLLYWGARGLGAYKNAGLALADDKVDRLDEVQWPMLLKTAEKLPRVRSRSHVYTIVGSRSHATAELDAFVARKRSEKETVSFIQAGSSLKICMVAEGTADVYPRFGPTMEWDTAAAHAVAAAAGVRVYDCKTGDPLRYNKPELLNPWFLVEK